MWHKQFKNIFNNFLILNKIKNNFRKFEKVFKKFKNIFRKIEKILLLIFKY